MRRELKRQKGTDKVESQCCSFSPDLKRAVMATRFKPSGQVLITVIDITEAHSMRIAAVIEDYHLPVVRCSFIECPVTD